MNKGGDCFFLLNFHPFNGRDFHFYCNLFVFFFYDIDAKKLKQYVISKTRNDIVEILKHKGRLHNYVILKEDENGRYCEYAFAPGAPDENRCLSWYNKLQPKALARNGHDIDLWKLTPVGGIYYLNAFTCGHQDKEDPELRCKPGCPMKSCIDKGCAKRWTYDEPVKCACWYLETINLMNMRLDLSIEDVVACVH